jgi:hypothetical protein
MWWWRFAMTLSHDPVSTHPGTPDAVTELKNPLVIPAALVMDDRVSDHDLRQYLRARRAIDVYAATGEDIGVRLSASVRARLSGLGWIVETEDGISLRWTPVEVDR